MKKKDAKNEKDLREDISFSSNKFFSRENEISLTEVLFIRIIVYLKTNTVLHLQSVVFCQQSPLLTSM